MSKVAIHQSQYIPWPPYFAKIAAADIFILMDDVQFQKNGVQNRNKIRNKEGDFWLTIPVTGHLSDSIAEKKIADKDWNKAHWKSLVMSYSKATFWNLYKDDLEDLYGKQYLALGEVNWLFLELLLKKLEIKTEIICLSKLNIKGEKSELVLNICKAVGAKEYISGLGGKVYLKERDFREAGVAINYKQSLQAVYRQFHGEFIPDLSILDMLFNADSGFIKEYLGGS